eukprot:90334-Pyramimonas_sp.AAC.1
MLDVRAARPGAQYRSTDPRPHRATASRPCRATTPVGDRPLENLSDAYIPIAGGKSASGAQATP